MVHIERHKSHRIGWLRAAVLGANDGIVSTASLVLGVASSGTDVKNILIAGTAGLVAGAMSMAAGEYISVSSQADTEKADLEREQNELLNDPEHELQEMTEIYIDRGLEKTLALEVAKQLMAHDALGAHARDELGIFDRITARPLQAAITSAVTFAVGAILPLIVVAIAPASMRIGLVSASSLLFLGILGASAARTGGASMLKGTLRVMFWSALAMITTSIVGYLFGVS